MKLLYCNSCNQDAELRTFSTFEYWFCTGCKKEIKDEPSWLPIPGSVKHSWDKSFVPWKCKNCGIDGITSLAEGSPDCTGQMGASGQPPKVITAASTIPTIKMGDEFIVNTILFDLSGVTINVGSKLIPYKISSNGFSYDCTLDHPKYPNFQVKVLKNQLLNHCTLQNTNSNNVGAFTPSAAPPTSTINVGDIFDANVTFKSQDGITINAGDELTTKLSLNNSQFACSVSTPGKPYFSALISPQQLLTLCSAQKRIHVSSSVPSGTKTTTGTPHINPSHVLNSANKSQCINCFILTTDPAIAMGCPGTFTNFTVGSQAVKASSSPGTPIVVPSPVKINDLFRVKSPFTSMNNVRITRGEELRINTIFTTNNTDYVVVVTNPHMPSYCWTAIISHGDLVANCSKISFIYPAASSSPSTSGTPVKTTTSLASSQSSNGAFKDAAIDATTKGLNDLCNAIFTELYQDHKDYMMAVELLNIFSIN